MSNPHVLVLPFPAQGHVNCLMNLSHKLSLNGIKVTFVNSDYNHQRMMKKEAMKENNETEEKLALMKFVSIPDGMGTGDDRNDVAKLCLAISSTMKSELERLLEDNIVQGGGDDRITCVLADVAMAWALEAANKLGVKAAVMCTSSAALFALKLHAPKLIHDGLIDSHGTPIIKGEFELSPEIPKMNTDHIPWCCVGDSITSQKILFDYIARVVRASHLTEWWLCNSVLELEPAAFSLFPKILPIGPLMSNYSQSLGQFWEEDKSCLKWLDQQQPCSVIYVAFGSFTEFNTTQFHELALGLELTQRPFLWVVRGNKGTKGTYPEEFEGKNGKIVNWAPQLQVLGHPAIACSVTHCGWNSVLEGLSNGVPFLCWPYFADHFFGKICICDAWKVGLGIDSDDEGLISRHEIKRKVEMLLEDEGIRERSMKLKKIIIDNLSEGGISFKNFSKFVEWVKQ